MASSCFPSPSTFLVGSPPRSLYPAALPSCLVFRSTRRRLPTLYYSTLSQKSPSHRRNPSSPPTLHLPRDQSRAPDIEERRDEPKSTHGSPTFAWFKKPSRPTTRHRALYLLHWHVRQWLYFPWSPRVRSTLLSLSLTLSASVSSSLVCKFCYITRDFFFGFVI